MFGSLKEKLKNWIKKTKEEDESPQKEEEIVKKPSTKKDNKSSLVKKSANKVRSDKQSAKHSGNSKTIKKEEIEVEEQPTKTPAKISIQKPEEKQSFFSKFQKKFTDEKFTESFSELELILLQNNVAYEAIDSIRDSLKEKLIGKNLKDVNLEKELKDSIESILINPPNFFKKIEETIYKEDKPFVILFAGINGSGKTTTIAKIANYLIEHGLSVCLAAADTFRAASIEQLQSHADRLKVTLIKKDYGSDPAAVAFDAITYAKKHKINVVLIDTAGRMQNKDSLMKEIEKISRVNKPDMKIFIGESITGNDATVQAKAFNEAINIDGIILSKADVDEKGGTAISVSIATGKPIFFLGTGQEYNDLEIFDKKKLIGKLGL